MTNFLSKYSREIRDWFWLALILLFIIIILIIILSFKLLKYIVRSLIIRCSVDHGEIQFNRSYTGRIVRVGDGDGVRVVVYGKNIDDIFFSQICTKKELRGLKSIPLRLYGVDAPESPCFGLPGQPYAQESRQCLSDKCFDSKLSSIITKNIIEKVVNKENMKKRKSKRPIKEQNKCEKTGNVQKNNAPQDKKKKDEVKIYKKCIFTPFAQDQYKRYVSEVKVGQTDLSMFLVKKGFSTVYYGKGACYNGKKEKLEKEEKKSRKNKIGMWAEQVELPGEYKRRMKIRAVE